MKLLLTGDWHLRFKRPAMRLDENYFETQAGKIRQIFEIAVEKGCSFILQPGDLFDSVETPWFVVQYYLSLFREYKERIWLMCIPGQHDLKYHTRDIENTPMGILAAAAIVYLNQCGQEIDNRITVYMSWWGREIPKPEIKGLNILLAHRMVIEKKLWLGQTDFVYARDLLKNYPDFDLFVTGDNHQAFVEESDSRYVVNCGSLMRASIDQVDHKPRVYVYDTQNKSLDEIFLKVESSEKVLNIKEAQIQKERDEKLDLFITTLKKSTGERIGYDFVDRLYEKMEFKTVDLETKSIIEEALAK